MAHIFPCFGWTSFIPKRQNFSSWTKKRKIEKRKRKGTLFSFNQELCVTAWLLFFCFLFHQKAKGKTSKNQRERAKKSKRHLQKAWFYGKYLVFRTFLTCLSAPCSGPRYRCGADTFLQIVRWSYRRRVGVVFTLSALEPTGKRREKREKGRIKKFAYWGWIWLQLDTEKKMNLGGGFWECP